MAYFKASNGRLGTVSSQALPKVSFKILPTFKWAMYYTQRHQNLTSYLSFNLSHQKRKYLWWMIPTKKIASRQKENKKNLERVCTCARRAEQAAMASLGRDGILGRHK